MLPMSYDNKGIEGGWRILTGHKEVVLSAIDESHEGGVDRADEQLGRVMGRLGVALATSRHSLCRLNYFIKNPQLGSQAKAGESIFSPSPIYLSKKSTD